MGGAPYVRSVARHRLFVFVAAAALAAGCSSAQADKEAAAAPRPVASSASPSASPSPSPTPAATDPLTGLAPRRTSSVVVLKVDNETLAWPYQRGLDRAAIVYQELMEGGSTRLAAVFDDGSAGEVGPIRSVRESDIELLSQLGRVAVGFSGGNRGVKASFRSAVTAGRLLDASYDAVPGDYRLGEFRADARNFFTSPAALAKDRPGSPARDIGLRFGTLPAVWGTAAPSARAAFSDAAVVTLRYLPSTHRWSVTQDSHLMAGVAPANVIVQRVSVQGSRYVDVLGNPTPYTVSTGSGPATILRDGRAFEATWRRPAVTAGTSYVDGAGHAVPLRPGPTWILLLPLGSPLTLG
ncbi:MAG: putative secreted protein [Frankiales bacterium]|nr:putative secreted protein [Frankiales bacterium]